MTAVSLDLVACALQLSVSRLHNTPDICCFEYSDDDFKRPGNISVVKKGIGNPNQNVSMAVLLNFNIKCPLSLKKGCKQ